MKIVYEDEVAEWWKSFKKNPQQNKCIVPAIDSLNKNFNILILPFKIMCANAPQKDYGLEIYDRLAALNKQDSLGLFLYFYECKSIGKMFNEDSARTLIRKSKFDLIIYGNYYDNACTNVYRDEICYNWATNERVNYDTLGNNVNVIDNYQPTSLQEFRAGNLQTGTDFLIYWFAAQSQAEKFHFNKALKYFYHIRNVLKIPKYEIITSIADCYLGLFQIDSAFAYNKFAIDYSKRKNDTVKLISSYAEVGKVFRYKGDYNKSLHYSDSAVQLLEQINPTKYPQLLKIYNYHSIILKHLNNLKESITWAEKGVTYFFAANDYRQIKSLSNLLGSLANSYERIGDFEKALKVNFDALAISKLLEKNGSGSVAVIYGNIAGNYFYIGDFEKSLKYCDSAFQIRLHHIPMEHPDFILSYMGYAMVYCKLGQSILSENYLDKAVKLAEKIYNSDHPKLADLYEQAVLISVLNGKDNMVQYYRRKQKKNTH